jgi:hypothetical protein
MGLAKGTTTYYEVRGKAHCYIEYRHYRHYRHYRKLIERDRDEELM